MCFASQVLWVLGSAGLWIIYAMMLLGFSMALEAFHTLVLMNMHHSCSKTYGLAPVVSQTGSSAAVSVGLPQLWDTQKLGF